MSNQPFPNLQSKITAGDGSLTPVWRSFFQALWDRSGGAIGTNYQPLNPNLSEIASLSPSGSDFIQASGGAWAARNPTQATSTLDVFTTALKGLVPPPATVAGKVLSDNGTWVVSSGGGGTGGFLVDDGTATATGGFLLADA